MWAVKWVASNPQMVDRDAPITNLQGQQTKHIKSKVVLVFSHGNILSIAACFTVDNAACSGKCRQNFSSIPLRPKFWQHESIGIWNNQGLTNWFCCRSFANLSRNDYLSRIFRPNNQCAFQRKQVKSFIESSTQKDQNDLLIIRFIQESWKSWRRVYSLAWRYDIVQVVLPATNHNPQVSQLHQLADICPSRLGVEGGGQIGSSLQGTKIKRNFEILNMFETATEFNQVPFSFTTRLFMTPICGVPLSMSPALAS